MAQLVTVDLAIQSDDLLAAAAYGAGAKVYLYSSASEGGVFALVGTGTTIVSGTESYEIWDAAGTSATWYQTRVGTSAGAGLTGTSEASAAFQVGTGGYTSLSLVKIALNVSGLTDTNNAVINGHVAAANQYLNGEIGAFIGPSADTSRIFDGHDAMVDWRRLYIPGGIRTATAMSVGSGTGATQTAAATADWYLGPRAWEKPGNAPYAYIQFYDRTTGNWSAFPDGYANVTVTGSFGWSAVPADLEELATRLAVKMFQARQSGQRDIVGTDEMGQPVVSRFLTSLDDKRLVRHYAASVEMYRYLG